MTMDTKQVNIVVFILSLFQLEKFIIDYAMPLVKKYCIVVYISYVQKKSTEEMGSSKIYCSHKNIIIVGYFKQTDADTSMTHQ